MSRNRALALLASCAVMLSSLVGVTALAPTAASAAPAVNYPPPPPSLVVNKGVVKYGSTVRALGRKYKARERVRVTISFLRKGERRYRTLRVYNVYTDRRGTFYTSVRTTRPGILVITAYGRSSRTSARASVLVINKRAWGRTVALKPVAFTGGNGASVAAPKPTAPAGDAGGLAIAGLGVLALAGSAVVTQRAVRRRRRVGSAA